MENSDEALRLDIVVVVEECDERRGTMTYSV